MKNPIEKIIDIMEAFSKENISICELAKEIKSPIFEAKTLYQCNYHKGICLKPIEYKQCHHKIMFDYRKKIGEVYRE